MTSDDLQSERRPRLATWKRVVLFAGFLGLGIALIAFLVGLGIYWHNTHARPMRTWPTIYIPHLELSASLRSMWRDGRLYYQLEMTPKDQTKLDQFDGAIRASSTPINSEILLYDSNGFLLCTIGPNGSNFIHEMNSDGKIAALKVNENSYSCELGSYLDAKSWSLSWTSFPDWINDVTSRGWQIVSESPAPKNPKGKVAKAPPSEGEDSITGVDIVRGLVDLRSGRTFEVTRSGEKSTIIMWNSNEKVIIGCTDTSNCILTNKHSEETVHGRLKQ